VEGGGGGVGKDEENMKGYDKGERRSWGGGGSRGRKERRRSRMEGDK
jgi:hypothetical protein